MKALAALVVVWTVMATVGQEPENQLGDPGDVIQDCEECPEMVVLPGGLALGRFEVTVGQYQAFVSARGRGESGCNGGGSWRRPPYPIGFSQTDRHPVSCVSWEDAQEYVEWLSERTGEEYRLPTTREWREAAAGTEPRCYEDSTRREGPCEVDDGTEGGLWDMFGNLWEWTADCGDGGDCAVVGGAWDGNEEFFQRTPESRFAADDRSVYRSLGS